MHITINCLTAGAATDKIITILGGDTELRLRKSAATLRCLDGETYRDTADGRLLNWPLHSNHAFRIANSAIRQIGVIVRSPTTTCRSPSSTPHQIAMNQSLSTSAFQ
jgi:hypothetical protein